MKKNNGQASDDEVDELRRKAKAIVFLNIIENGDAQFLASIVRALTELDTKLAMQCHAQMLEEPINRVGAKETTLRHEVIIAFAQLADHVINTDVRRLDVLIGNTDRDTSKKALLH